MENLNRFVLKITLFIAPQMLIVTAFAAYFTFNTNPILPYESLYQYQANKIQGTGNYDTVFIGDSSGGNAIDAEYFSQATDLKAMNTALAGIYGYAGSYNMLKKFHEKNPGVKNVFIIHTLDISCRPLSYQGYLYTMDDWADFSELSFDDQIKVIRSAYNITGQVRELFRRLIHSRKIHYQNDYMKQGKKIENPSKEIHFSVDEIVKGKYKFLKKISFYAKQNNLNILYLHGPCYENIVKQSQEYIDTINRNIAETGLEIVKETIPMPDSDLGDAYDHVAPKMKQTYTRKYIELIQKTEAGNSAFREAEKDAFSQ